MKYFKLGLRTLLPPPVTIVTIAVLNKVSSQISNKMS